MALFPYLPKNMKPNRLLPLVLLLTALSAYAKDFIIYDRMDYVGKPDLTADKLSKVFLVYESELVKPDPTGKRKHGVLNEARIRELAKQSRREGYRTISTDIESWFAEKDGQLLTPDELRTDFARMYQIFREENPRASSATTACLPNTCTASATTALTLTTKPSWPNGGKSANAVRPPPPSATMPILCSTSLPPIWRNGKKT